MTIVFASHSNFDNFLVVGSHQLAREAALLGHFVCHVGPPVTAAHFLLSRREDYRHRVAETLGSPVSLGEGLMAVTPFSMVPWQIARHFLGLGNAFVRFSNVGAQLKKALDRRPVDVLLVDDPRFVGLDEILQAKSLYYRPTDLYSELKHDPIIVNAERRLLARSQGVIATSQPVLDHALNLNPSLPSLLLENGFDHRHFGQKRVEPGELAGVPHPRVLYVGAIDFRFDTDLVHTLARALPHIQFIIIGLGDQLKKLHAHAPPNLHIWGPRPYEMVPAYLQHCDAAILPFTDVPANAGRSPMKLYEFGASGLPVLAKSTPELRRRRDSFTYLFSSTEEAVQKLREIVQMPSNREEISRSCMQHAWARKTATLLDFVSRNPAKAASGSDAAAPSKPLVCLNGRFLSQELTGVQRYAHGMLANLGSRMRLIRASDSMKPWQGHLWEQLVLPFLCGRALLWSPGNTGPLVKRKQVVTIHDASTLDHPEWFSGKFAMWYRFLLPRLARRAKKIITVSEFSKKRLMATCQLPADKIAVVYNAIEPRFQPTSPQLIAEFRQRRALERPYCLYVGSLEPRKNLRVLLDAWKLLGANGHELVLAGGTGHVFREKGFGEPPPGARFFGRVEDDDLPTLLAGARCFIFPSLYEGFGYPPLEAMACGCPVVCSDATSLPEVCGPAFDSADINSKGTALYFDPRNPEHLAAQVRKVLGLTEDAIQRLKKNGLAWAANFSWSRCFAETWAVLSEAERA